MSTEVSLDYLKKLKDDQTTFLIDVREPHELEKTGQIPGSINIPLGTLKNTLTSDEETFKAKYKRNKPEFSTPLVFHCQSGRRSQMAIETAKNLGFVNAKHFPGGWVEWEKSQKHK